MKRIGIFIIFLLIPFVSYAQNEVTGFRAYDHDDYSRFVIDLDKKPEYKSFILENPPRAVVDINNTVWNDNLSPHSHTKRIKGVRYSPKSSPLRIVLDLNTKANIIKNFILEPRDGKPYRLVIDLQPINLASETKIKPVPVSKDGKSFNSPKLPVKRPRKPLIVIDAGHGGHDPGTIGYRKTYEKDITLAYSKELKKQLEATGRYKVYMTRSNDVYLKLGTRVAKARKVKGDMLWSSLGLSFFHAFISLREMLYH